jgi:hypothetical protein
VVSPKPTLELPHGDQPRWVDARGCLSQPCTVGAAQGRNRCVISNLETCGDADDVFFDAARNRIYVSCGQGAVDVFDLSRTEPVRLARVDTSSGARTALFVPELDRLFVAAHGGWFGGGAKLLIYGAVKELSDAWISAGTNFLDRCHRVD